MLAFAFVVAAATLAQGVPTAADPCTAIANVKWAAPSAVRACLSSFPLNNTLRANILDVVSKTFNFHTSVNYQIQAPPPFNNDVHVDLQAQFRRMATQRYASDFAFHQDLQNTVKLLRDGHAAYGNLCFDSVFVTFVPFPLVAMSAPLVPGIPISTQAIHIAPEAFDVASNEFADEIAFWEAVPGLQNLSSFSGARVLLINGQDPWTVADANANIVGSFQGFGTRQSAFFSSYALTATGWAYRMGDFAQQGLPIVDSVTLTVLKTGSLLPVTVTVPYRARLSAGVTPFTDAPSFFAGNCLAGPATNGQNLNGLSPAEILNPPTSRAQQFLPPVDPRDRFLPMDVAMGDEILADVALPSRLVPGAPVSINGAMAFFMLDKTTGVLALGSFSGTFNTLQSGLLSGLQGLKASGATRLIVDVTNNGGGFICIAHWLHRIIVGPLPTSEPQAGLDTKARAQTLAKHIVTSIVHGSDPNDNTLLNPLNWRFANGTDMPADFDWMTPSVDSVINGHPDSFSNRLGEECQPFSMTPPDAPLFDTKRIAIVNNGRCASSCSLFTITMKDHYNVTTVVVGGKEDVKQEFCGTVGGQSVNFVTMDTDVKTSGNKGDPLAAPDFLTASSLGVTFRLGFSIFHPNQPEEWQDHPAAVNFQQTAATVNNPVALWTAIAAQFLPK